MDSSNNHHHHHVQDHVVGSSSSYGVGTTTHAWSTTPTSFMKTTNINGLTSHPSDQPVLLSTQYDPDMAGPNFAYRNLPVHVQDYYRKYADLLNGNEHNLMNKTADQISPGDQWLYSNHGREHCTQIFPSTNVSSLNQMDMNSEARDLLTSSSFSGNLGASSRNYNEVGISRDHGFYTFGAFDDHMRQPHHARLYDIDKISIPISNGSSVETKRSSNKVEPKAPSQNVTKKSRLEARASCPPFKVRKEKLGDRIAALQQLVSPFGKTDTASVLMEAIGYIKFLQDQVETLSVPYMKASHNMSSRVIKENEKDGEPKRDLKSRGLCLVPVSCVSYITDGGGAVVWPPPHFS